MAVTETELWKGLGGDRIARIITNALLRKYGRDVIDAEFLRKEEYYLTDIPNIGPVAMDRIETYIRPPRVGAIEFEHTGPASERLWKALPDNYTGAEKARLMNDWAAELSDKIRDSEWLRDLTDDHMGDCNAAADVIDPRVT